MAKEIHKRTSVTINLRRFERGKFVREHYRLALPMHETVLDALIKIKRTKDSSLAIRYSCRMGICGSCAMVINGKPSLACETRLHQNETIEVEPMQGHPVLRDLVSDLDDFFEKLRSVKPWMISDRKTKYYGRSQTGQTAQNVEAILPFSSCIECGLCVDACPVSNTNTSFIGPQALAQTYKFYKDSRDHGKQERLALVDHENGMWGCEYAGACSRVCPKGVDPAFAIQELKMETMKQKMLNLIKKR